MPLVIVSGRCRADTVLDYEGPGFTRLVIQNDHPEAASRRRTLDRAPGPVRVRIRLSDSALASDGEARHNNQWPDEPPGLRSVEIVADDLVLAYANRQQPVEFSLKVDQGQVVQWQLRGSANGGRQTLTLLGPGRTRTGRGSTIDGAGACPALDIVELPGLLTWYCGLGTWRISRTAPEAMLPPLSTR